MWLIYALYAASKGEDHLHSPLEFLMAGFNAHEKKVDEDYDPSNRMGNKHKWRTMKNMSMGIIIPCWGDGRYILFQTINQILYD